MIFDMTRRDGGIRPSATIQFSSYESFDETYNFLSKYIASLLDAPCSFTCEFENNTANARAGILVCGVYNGSDYEKIGQYVKRVGVTNNYAFGFDVYAGASCYLYIIPLEAFL